MLPRGRAAGNLCWKMRGLGKVCGILGTVAALVSDDQFHISAPAQSAIAAQAMDGGEVVGFQAEAVIVEANNRRVNNFRRVKLLKRWPAGLEDAGRLIFEERLIGSYLACLSWSRHRLKFLEALPP